jgi:hypothetical protein
MRIRNKIHFDTRQYNFILWEHEKLDELRTSVQNRIEATIGRAARMPGGKFRRVRVSLPRTSKGVLCSPDPIKQAHFRVMLRGGIICLEMGRCVNSSLIGLLQRVRPFFYLIAAGRIYLTWISSDGDCSL